MVQADPVTMTAGLNTNVSATLAAIPTSSQVSIRYRRSAFKAYASQVSPGAVSNNDLLLVDALPGYASRGDFADAPDLINVSTDTATADLDFGSMSYGNPFTGWDPFVIARSGFVTRWMAPGAVEAAAHQSYISVTAPLADANLSALAPIVSPPRSLQIGGLPANVDRSGVGTTPTLSWAAPALGTPTYYGLNVYRVGNYGGVTMLTLVTSGWTGGTSFTLPAGLLRPGESYFSNVIAFKRDVSVLTTPFKRTPQQSHATAVTSAFTP
jgi:hypothetical protein